jgi:hypothetical protein
MAGYVIQPSPREREASLGKISDGWREVQPAKEPRFHGVLIGGANIKKMLTHQRPHMTAHDLLCHGIDRVKGPRRACRRSDE